MWNMGVLGLRGAAVGWVLTLCACAAQIPSTALPPAKNMQQRSTGVIPVQFEQLTAQVDLLGILLGSIDSRICSDEGSGKVRLSTTMQSGPLVSLVKRIKSEAQTDLDATKLLPTESEYGFRDGKFLRHYKVRHLPGVFEHSYDNGGRRRRIGRQRVPEGAFPHDLHSAVVAIRNWRPRLGDKGTLYIVLGRRLWRVDLVARGAEVITIDKQPRVAFRVDGHAARLALPELPPIERDFGLWLSEGSERIPLRLVADSKLGEITILLRNRRTNADVCKSPEVLSTR